jgi:preprotein translocase SecE subunit
MATATTGSNSGEGGGGLPLPKSRRGIKGFINEVVRELKKVSCPPKHETNRLTGVVMAVTLIFIIILTGFSLIAQTLVNLLTKGTV